jgi:hypothetical protein
MLLASFFVKTVNPDSADNRDDGNDQPTLFHQHSSKAHFWHRMDRKKKTRQDAQEKRYKKEKEKQEQLRFTRQENLLNESASLR